ncbi:MAG: septum site-determining protein MinC [Catonella sp.]|uniref:septum site-determining protein MinC n=1 Tax=Catonella sp. TaxID=2382125 RepID=UPI003FA00C30
MKEPVVIKANNFGILIILDKDLGFDSLLEAVGNKFKESANFFGNADMAVAFDGRKLTFEEEEQIIQAIIDNSSLNVVCTVDHDPIREAQFKAKLDQIAVSKDMSLAKIHKGNFRSGKMMEFDTGVIIIGDINPGAKVSSKGSIIVLGSLKGEVAAGIDGNNDAFIIALDMNPIQLRIGASIGRCSDDSETYSKAKDLEPKVAFVENNTICIENLDKNALDSLRL